MAIYLNLKLGQGAEVKHSYVLSARHVLLTDILKPVGLAKRTAVHSRLCNRETVGIHTWILKSIFR